MGCWFRLGASPVPCAESEIFPADSVPDFPAQHTCARLDWPAEEDRWYFLIYRVDQ
jgi:hypothetical protein